MSFLKVKCRKCGKEFLTIPSRIKNGRAKFCSKICYLEHHKKKEVEAICQYCGKKFLRRLSEFKRGRFKFCSHQCAQDRMKKENHPCWKGRKLKTCPICGENYFVPLGRFKRRITCSKPCYRIHLSRNFNREKSHMWRGGIANNPYTSEFNNIIKKEIRRKQGGICGVCHSNAHVGNLHIHHIDYNKKNSSENNLIGLCKSCHGKTNFNRDFWKEFFTVRNI